MMHEWAGSNWGRLLAGMGLLWAIGWGAAQAAPASVAQASAVEAGTGREGRIVVTDVLGRQVEIELPVRRIILEEARQAYAVAMLEGAHPFGRIVGWGGDLEQADPATYAQYLKVFPEIREIPVLGRLADASFNLERAVALRPDVLFLNMETARIADDARYLETLDSLGIPVVYVDFRHHPERNTEPSLRLFGDILGQRARTEDFIAFRARERARVTERLALADVPQPRVFIERMGGFAEECCYSFGDENMGHYVEMAGGHNLAAEVLPGTFGQLSPEQVLAMSPDVVLVTSADWSAFRPDGDWIPVGPGADAVRARQALARYLDKSAYSGSPAVAQRRFYAIWHQFYNSPYDFVAVQQLAKWMHPALFEDLDVDETFRTLHARFLPVPYAPGYFAALEGEHDHAR